MRSLLIRLYPARWRARYGDEFEAILEERALGPFDVADILLGALDAQLRLRGHGADIHQGRGFSMSLRIGGIAAIVGSSFWGAGLLLWSVRPAPIGPTGPSILLIAGSLALLVALAGLSAFQARVHPVLTWGAFVVSAIGTLAFVVGFLGITLVGDEPFWVVWMLGVLTALAGSALFAVATYRTAALSRGAAALIGVGVGSVLPFVAMNIQVLAGLALVCFLLGWFALGVQAIRLDRPATATRSV